MRQLEIIGEAANRLSRDFQKRNAHVRWADIIGMRNILIHDYFNVDVKEVWHTVESDIPQLIADLESILKA